jgi:hypothetical protein
MRLGDVVRMTAVLPAAAQRRRPAAKPAAHVPVPPGLSADEAQRALSAIARGAQAMLRSGQAVTLDLRPAGAGSTTRFVIVPTKRDAPASGDAPLPPAAARAALARAYARGAATAAEILGAPDMLSSDVLAERLGLSREAVHQKRRRGELLGLEGAKRGVRFPAWQIGPDGRAPAALPQLLEALGEPWAAFRFLRATHAALGGRSGIAALSDPRWSGRALALARQGATFGPAGA